MNQNFNNYEIIIINDYSKDRSLKICTKYKKKYPKIKIINHKTNKGVSSSRNLGIESSNGEYIIFLDSDDYLENFSLYKLSKFHNVEWKWVKAHSNEPLNTMVDELARKAALN